MAELRFDERLIAPLSHEKSRVRCAFPGTGSTAEEDSGIYDERDDNGHLLWIIGCYQVSYARGAVGVNLSELDYNSFIQKAHDACVFS